MQDTVTGTYKDLVAGELPQFKAMPVKIGASQIITVGTVLASGGISADGETFTKCNSGSGTASERVPVCVALEAVTTGANGSATIMACFQGELNVTLNAGGSDTQYTHQDALRARGIFIRKNV